MLQTERHARERIERIEQAISEALGNWSLAPIVPALMAMRGINLVATATILAEIGDLSRFANPRQLMAYVGLVPSERSTGETVKRGSITKAGNGRARRVLVEAAWAYRHPARVGAEKQATVSAAPRPAREIAWKAQVRLCKRFRTLSRKGKKSTVVATAIARDQEDRARRSVRATQNSCSGGGEAMAGEPSHWLSGRSL
jgi:transposase